MVPPEATGNPRTALDPAAGVAAATPVAVIGMACRLPGGISSPEQFWMALLRGDDLVTEVPRERWDIDDYYDPEPGVAGRTTSKWGAFLDDVTGFDADFFAINEREAAALDPQHRLLLETSWEAVEHAGLTPEAMAGSPTGVFMGLTHLDYQLINAESEAMEGPYGFEGNTFSMASGRIAYTMGLTGPAMTVDTACSSGLMAVHLGCRNLGDGDCDLALAGGAFVMLEPRKFVAGSSQSHLSPTGRCHAFDVAADGYVCGEAAAVVLLKRLPDAIRDGDRVLAVIRGTAANQDGHTVNISTPSVTAQAALYRRTLAAAGVDAASVGMVEAHGPGTPVGDPIEYASLSEVYGVESPCALGSVKTNLGHAQSASGLVGLIKAVLAVDHGVVPKNLHFNKLPDEMAKVDTKLFVPQDITPWPATETHPRRVAVSSYGVSGTNVHAVLEQAPEQDTPRSAEGTAADAALVLPLSSTSPEELRRTAGLLAEWVESHEEVGLHDLGYTLARRRGHRPVRTAAIARDRDELAQALRAFADDEAPRPAAVGRDDRGPVWVFSGQGSQWAGMGRELLATEPVFAETVAALEPLIAEESGFSVTAAMTSTESVTGIDRVQPTVFAVQVAMAAALAAHGARPGAVIGHSMGETAAAVVAGALSMQDGARVICRRSALMATIAGSGAMGSVELPAKQVLSELTMRGIKNVVVAVVASPTSTVIGGDAQTVHELIAGWEQQDVMARAVAVDVASHSPQVDPILDRLQQALADLTPMPPTIPFYSATGFDPRDEPVCNAKYWMNNLRRTVRFAAAVRAALEDGHRVFAEIAPHPLLTHAVAQTAQSVDVPLATLAALRRDGELPHGLRGLVADLYAAGAAVDFTALYPDGLLVDAPLPTWTHRQLWLDPDSGGAGARGGHTVAAHPLLGPHVGVHDEPGRHLWQGQVGTAAQPWLADHRIHGVAVLPGAAYCEMALAAACTVLGESCEVVDIAFADALLLDDDTAVAASTALSATGTLQFAVESRRDEFRTVCATAALRTAADEPPPPYPIAEMLAAHPDTEAGDEVRTMLTEAGIDYGPAFQGLTALRIVDDRTVLAQITLPPQIRTQTGLYGVHPAILDACFQAVAASPQASAVGAGALALPLGARRLRAYGPARTAQYCVVRVVSADASGVEADLDVTDQNGAVLLRVEGLLCGDMGTGIPNKDRVLGQRLLTVEWRPGELPEPSSSYAGNWVLIDAAQTADMAGGSLSDAMKEIGAQCTTVTCPPHADTASNAQRLAGLLAAGEVSGVVILAGDSGTADEAVESPLYGREFVEHLVHITRELAQLPGQPPPLFTVTRLARTVLDGETPNLQQAGARGLLRVVAAEYPQLRITQIDIDASTEGEQLARQLLSGSDEDETAWRRGTWYTARLHPAPLRPEERRRTAVDFGCDGARLRIRTPGDLQTLELIAQERAAPGPGQIEVAVSVSSINFADALNAMGLFPALDGELPELGMDFAGVVSAVGPGVVEHRVGDPVVGFSRHGCWGTFVLCDARLAVPRPAALSEHQAVAAATAAATAWYGLHDQARITAEDRVLIHSATGGVGQAAIAVARAAGAEIFATAGSEERRDLLRGMGIEHVYDSRSIDFAEQIRRDTGGYGVDIVLNSLTGAAQRAGLELLALGGRFVEIGKRDVYGNTRIGLFPFRRNLTFHYVDLALMSVSHPQRTGELLRTVLELAADGSAPTPEHTVYPLAEAADAIRVMTSAQHTGKLLLEVPRSGSTEVAIPPEEVAVFRSDGAYLVSGGLGGLGLLLAGRMAAGGCGRIVLASRTQPGPEAVRTIDGLRLSGADVVVACGDITDPDFAASMVDIATATGLPVRGVLHAAAVVEDAMLPNITDDLILRDWAPKVSGAWNLHAATTSQPVDWFCSFSSAAALVGSPGQGAYAAANSWLDAFSLWRRAQGFAATTIAWGAWGQAGRATGFAENVGAAIGSEEGAYAFETLLRYDRPYTGYSPIIGAAWLTAFAQRSPFAEAFRYRGHSEAPANSLLTELSELPLQEWPSRLRRLISDQITMILRRTIDPDRPLSEYGVDSLGALELRTRLESETGIRLTPADVAVGTVRRLAESLTERLLPGRDGGESPLETPA